MTYEEEFEEFLPWDHPLKSTFWSIYLAGRKKGEEERKRLREAIEESLADNLPYLSEKRLRAALEQK